MSRETRYWEYRSDSSRVPQYTMPFPGSDVSNVSNASILASWSGQRITEQLKLGLASEPLITLSRLLSNCWAMSSCTLGVAVAVQASTGMSAFSRLTTWTILR